jgi:hypothetical protein
MKESGGGPAGVVEGAKLVERRVSGVEGGSLDEGTRNMFAVVLGRGSRPMR